MVTSAGYSSTPLAKKLGIKEGYVIRLIQEPQDYISLFSDWPANVVTTKAGEGEKDLIHFFITKAEDLFAQLPLLKKEIKQTGMIWVSWPKKASKVLTDVTEDLIREFALHNGLVDVKVCAVDDVWSGLKLMIPVKERR